MKKILTIAIAVAAALSFTACTDSDLDSTNYTEANTANFPSSEADLNQEIAALYGVMNQYANDPLQTPWFVNTIMSDDCNGAGGTGDVESHAIGHLMSNKETLLDTAWKSTYVGIARANSIIAAMDNISMSGDKRDQLLGEAYFMRGLFYLWGTQFWGDIPAYWQSTAPDPCLRQSAEDVIYPHILSDFKTAITLMKHGATTKGDGHATKAAAEGFLARAYMFYEGFYKKAGELAKASPAAVELFAQEGIEEGETLSKEQVIAYLEDAVQNSGASLVSDFRLLWQYTNEYTIKEYSYVADLWVKGQQWAGNGNSEEIFQVQFCNSASWNGTVSMGFTNMTSLYTGLRCGDSRNGMVAESVPFGQGWGQGTFNANLWDDWSDADPRKLATILDAPTELGEGVGFVFVSDCSEDAGYYNKKLMPIITSRATFDDNTNAYTWWGTYRADNTTSANNNGNSFQGDHFADIMLMRLADIYLMHTELAGDKALVNGKTGLNLVRERAGMPDKAYSWTAIQDERRWEFAGEGLRFNDLRRWSGKNGGESCLAAQALQKQSGTRVNYCGNWVTMHHASSSWAQRYAETDGFLQIPPEQIRIVDNEDVLKQNEGWDASKYPDCNMSGTPVYTN